MKQSTDNKVEYKDRDIYITPKADHSQTLIWLHGLGDEASSFLPQFNSNSSPLPKGTRIVMLTASTMPVTFNHGMKMTAWYDFKSLDCSSPDSVKDVNLETIKESSERIQKVMKEEIELLKGNSTQLFLGGFSQGAILSLYVGLQYPERIAGIIACSGICFPIIQISKANSDVPVFISHGELDPVIPFQASMISYEKIEKSENKIIKIINKVGHTISNEAWLGIKKFVQECLEVQKKSKL